MKNIYEYLSGAILVTTLSLGVVSCTPEKIDSPVQTGLPLIADYESNIIISVDQETNIVTFKFDGKGAMPIWIIDGKQYSTNPVITKYYRKKGEYSIDVKVLNRNGMSDGMITKTFQIEKTIMSGFGGFVYDSDFNMWKNATISEPTFWYAPGWTQIGDPSYSKEEGGFIVNLPEETTDQWQGQMLIETDMSSVSTSNYDFSVVLTSTTDHPGVTVKLVDSTDDNIFYFADRVALKANEPTCYWKSDLEGKDIEKLKMVFDFGGNKAGTEVAVENIVFKDHANDDGTVLPEIDDTPEPAWVDINSELNLWNGATFDSPFFFYAPGWAETTPPSMTQEGNAYTLGCPVATTDQWQNQFHIITQNLGLDKLKEYDFKVTINASNDIANATVKFVQDGGGDNDNIFLFVENKALVAGEDVVIKAIKRKLEMEGEITKAKLVFDFGGNPENTEIIIKDILIQEHRE